MNTMEAKQAGKRKKLISALLLAGILASVLYYIIGGFVSQAKAARLPDVTMQSLSGQPYALKEGTGKVRMVELIYTRCPDVCPITTVKMVELQKRLKQDGLFGNRVEFVTVTIDPENDTAEVLADYAAKLQIDQEGWHVLRGDPDQTKTLTQSLGFYTKTMEDGLISHTTSTYLIAPDNTVKTKFGMGESMDAEKIYREILKMSKEGS